MSMSMSMSMPMPSASSAMSMSMPMPTSAMSMSMPMASGTSAMGAMASSMASMTMSAMSGMSGMAMPTGSPTASAAASSSSSAHAGMAGMAGMGDMGSGSGAACKISMLWNWNVEDSCFLANSWHITSRGMFGGTCVGIVFLVVALEFVRRMHREYDRFIVRQWKASQEALDSSVVNDKSSSSQSSFAEKLGSRVKNFNGPLLSNRRLGILGSTEEVFSPTLFQQLIRSVFYVVTAGAGYIVMLLLMYFNGYIFFCVLIGALIGYFFFESDVVATSNQKLVTCC